MQNEGKGGMLAVIGRQAIIGATALSVGCSIVIPQSGWNT